MITRGTGPGTRATGPKRPFFDILSKKEETRPAHPFRLTYLLQFGNERCLTTACYATRYTSRHNIFLAIALPPGFSCPAGSDSSPGQHPTSLADSAIAITGISDRFAPEYAHCDLAELLPEPAHLRTVPWVSLGFRWVSEGMRPPTCLRHWWTRRNPHDSSLPSLQPFSKYGLAFDQSFICIRPAR